MIVLLILAFAIYNVPNIQNSLSRGIVFACMIFVVGAVMVNIILCKMCGRRNKSFFRLMFGNFRNGIVFSIARTILIIIILFNQFVYEGYAEITTKFENMLTPENQYEEYDNSVEQFMVYNSFIIPRGIKEALVMIGDISTTLSELKDDEEQLKVWYDENIDKYRDTEQRMENDMKTLNVCLTFIVIITVLQKLWQLVPGNKRPKLLRV